MIRRTVGCCLGLVVMVALVGAAAIVSPLVAPRVPSAISAVRHGISVLEADLKGKPSPAHWPMGSTPTPAPTAQPTATPTPLPAPIDVAPPPATITDFPVVQLCDVNAYSITLACEQAAVAAINSARAAEPTPLPPLALPQNFYTMPQAEQMFVLINLERVSRNLTPILGLSAALDQQAVGLAAQNADPTLSSTVVAGSWAGGSGAAAEVYEWLYDDGPDSPNIDCTPSNESGCWGHRANLFADPAGLTDLTAGIGCVPYSVAPGAGNMDSCTIEIAVGQPGPLVYSWSAIEGSQVGN